MKCSTDNLYVRHQYSFNMGCGKSCYEHVFLTDNLNVAVDPLS